MHLSKNKLIKILKTKNQTCKKGRNCKRIKKYKTQNKYKRQFNLRHKTLRRLIGGGKPLRKTDTDVDNTNNEFTRLYRDYTNNKEKYNNSGAIETELTKYNIKKKIKNNGFLNSAQRNDIIIKKSLIKLFTDNKNDKKVASNPPSTPVLPSVSAAQDNSLLAAAINIATAKMQPAAPAAVASDNSLLDTAINIAVEKMQVPDVVREAAVNIAAAKMSEAADNSLLAAAINIATAKMQPAAQPAAPAPVVAQPQVAADNSLLAAAINIATAKMQPAAQPAAPAPVVAPPQAVVAAPAVAKDCAEGNQFKMKIYNPNSSENKGNLYGNATVQPNLADGSSEIRLSGAIPDPSFFSTITGTPGQTADTTLRIMMKGPGTGNASNQAQIDSSIALAQKQQQIDEEVKAITDLQKQIDNADNSIASSKDDMLRLINQRNDLISNMTTNLRNTT